MTKREIHKWTSSIFDPLGLITPVTISAKLFLQQLWQKQLGWDTELSEELCKAWEGISRNVIQTAEMSFSHQCVNMSPTPDTTLHVFADASPRAYGAGAYFQQGTSSSLVMSKSRAAPLKTLSMPKLELLAAVLAARLCVFITTSLHILTVRSCSSGSPARKRSNHLSLIVSVKYNLSQPLGDTAHPLTIPQIYSPEV